MKWKRIIKAVVAFASIVVLSFAMTGCVRGRLVEFLPRGYSLPAYSEFLEDTQVICAPEKVVAGSSLRVAVVFTKVKEGDFYISVLGFDLAVYLCDGGEKIRIIRERSQLPNPSNFPMMRYQRIDFGEKVVFESIVNIPDDATDGQTISIGIPVTWRAEDYMSEDFAFQYYFESVSTVVTIPEVQNG